MYFKDTKEFHDKWFNPRNWLAVKYAVFQFEVQYINLK